MVFCFRGSSGEHLRLIAGGLGHGVCLCPGSLLSLGMLIRSLTIPLYFIPLTLVLASCDMLLRHICALSARGPSHLEIERVFVGQLMQTLEVL